MQEIEPFYNWLEYYTSEEDEASPFFGKEYNEFEFTNTIYNYFIHPQWDEFGSATLYLKVLLADYDTGVAIIEFIGEWNDTLYNDIMFLKRDVIDVFIGNGINKFILIGENVLNFHGGDDDYYEEWFDDIGDGWIAAINFREHVEDEMIRTHIDRYVLLGAPFNNLNWRKYKPQLLALFVENIMQKKLSTGF
ncbi:MAG: hypothetical protein KBF42_06660 [Chitinophagales bacterium]|jgi:hypothetical protein|nr:hypothetical protein [Bacteroidota bacterium]MBP8915945.1 hypothetical protein [Chitinophagales bacterium]MBP9221046.1 hypothetical protein [Chitinophagales bacterium]MBP9796916.1 hypothetical protein [Chitinophagales bacterium]